MMKMTLQELIDLIESAGYEARISYSGRGMYGETCLSVNIFRGTKEAEVVADIMLAAAENATDLEDAINKMEYLGNLFASSCTDSLGLDTVLYFPQIKTSYRP